MAGQPGAPSWEGWGWARPWQGGDGGLITRENPPVPGSGQAAGCPEFSGSRACIVKSSENISSLDFTFSGGPCLSFHYLALSLHSVFYCLLQERDEVGKTLLPSRLHVMLLLCFLSQQATPNPTTDNSYYCADNIFSAFLTTLLRSGSHHYSHFANEETKAQRTCKLSLLAHPAHVPDH